MHLTRLKQAEAAFFRRYPGGFDNPEMVAIGKKHKMDKMVELAQQSFAKESFKHPTMIIENMVKIIGRSSMVSVFEKPKFKDFANALMQQDQMHLVEGMKLLLHGKQQQGFEKVLDVLKTGKLAKWSLISICPAYFRPQDEVFVKPTTAKGVIEFFELKNLKYHPTPSWEFYRDYRAAINEMKTKVDASLAPSNAAFSGFLMMTMQAC